MAFIRFYYDIIRFKFIGGGVFMFFVILIGFIIVNLLVRRFVIPKVYTGQPFEDGRAFNKPNWIEMIESAFWLLLSITQVYQVYAVGWNVEVIMSLIFVFIFGGLWLSRSMDIYNFQHSEIRLTPNQIVFRSENEEWTTLQNITAVYFTSIPTKRFTLSDQAKDFAMGVQRDGEEDVIINIQGMYLRCYIAAIVEWSRKLYTVIQEPKTTSEDSTQEPTPSSDDDQKPESTPEDSTTDSEQAPFVD